MAEYKEEEDIQIIFVDKEDMKKDKDLLEFYFIPGIGPARIEDEQATVSTEWLNTICSMRDGAMVILESLEWTPPSIFAYAYCPTCHNRKPNHKDNCALDAILNKWRIKPTSIPVTKTHD